MTGRMVLDLIETCNPPPPPATGAGLPSDLIKVALVGRPFAGKSLQAQRLADAHDLTTDGLARERIAVRAQRACRALCVL